MQERGIGNRTRNNYLASCTAVFNLLLEREILHKNPCHGIGKLKQATSRNIAFSDKEKKIMEDHLTHDPLFFNYIQFIYHEFIRPKELLASR